MKHLKKILNAFFAFLPHMNIALSLCFAVFYIVDRFNRPMAFINNEITKGMLIVFAVLVIIQSVHTVIQKHR